MENILVCMVVTKGDTADFVYALNTIFVTDIWQA